jgi:hypothetical protein
VAEEGRSWEIYFLARGILVCKFCERPERYLSWKKNLDAQAAGRILPSERYGELHAFITSPGYMESPNEIIEDAATLGAEEGNKKQNEYEDAEQLVEEDGDVLAALEVCLDSQTSTEASKGIGTTRRAKDLQVYLK